MFEFIERWMGRRRRKAILKDIKKAKAIYLSGAINYMCQCFYWVDRNRYENYEIIRKRIPEFKPGTFNVDPSDIKGAWWPTRSRKSRIEAFDKLIEIYSK
jgi:hypothetical protein